jgi:hypothetical protein
MRNVDYMGRNVDLGDSEFRPLADSEKESYRLPAGAPVDVANTGKKANLKTTTEAPCPDDNKPSDADSFAHRK